MLKNDTVYIIYGCKYEPFADEFFFADEREGIFPHALLLSDSGLYKISLYTAKIDSIWYVATGKKKYWGMVPSYYIEADSISTPYTLYRDGYIDYGGVKIEYGEDSLVYYFNEFISGRKYNIVIEFYLEENTGSEVLIHRNSAVDSFYISPGVFSWYTASLDELSSLKLKIEKLSGELIGISRILIIRKDPQSFLVSGIKGRLREFPSKFLLYQNLPNPFIHQTLIQYVVPKTTWVSLKVYDVSGRLVRTLVNRVLRPGIYRLYWRGEDDSGRRCASGVYFLRMSTKDYKKTRKMVMLK